MVLHQKQDTSLHKLLSLCMCNGDIVFRELNRDGGYLTVDLAIHLGVQ